MMQSTMTREALGDVITRVVKVMLAIKGEDQSDLALVLGLRPGAVTDRMVGRTRWSVDDLEAMATHFGIRAGDFLRLPEALIAEPHLRREARD